MDMLTFEMPSAKAFGTGRIKVARSTLLIGVGELHKHDEQVGLYVARRVRQECNDAIRVIEETKDVLDLMELWQTADLVFVVDAIVDGRGPGAIHRFEICPGTGCDEDIPPDVFFSLRVLGLADAIQLAESLDKLPSRLIIYGIEAERFGTGEGLSLPVLAAAEEVVREILQYLRHGVTV